MIMDYIEGKTVKDILSGGKSLPVKDSCEIILQVLDGLGACHQQRLIHRDLTPDNIYITTKGGGRSDLDLLEKLRVAKMNLLKS